MSRLRVVITATAQAHVRAVVRWCVKNDRSVPETVLVELDGVIARIGEHPHSGHLYLQSPIDGVYRVLLRRSGYHVYFTVDENVGDVVVRAVLVRRSRYGADVGVSLHQTSASVGSTPIAATASESLLRGSHFGEKCSFTRCLEYAATASTVEKLSSSPV